MIKSVFVPYLSGLMHEGVPLSPPKSLDWYPEGYAWQLNIAKTHIRKNDAFKRFQHFLVYETDAGNISRQEAVSMIPPLLLDILPHHYVRSFFRLPADPADLERRSLMSVPHLAPSRSSCSKLSTSSPPNPPTPSPRSLPAFSSQMTRTPSAATCSFTNRSTASPPPG